MATYSELYRLEHEDSVLRARVYVACSVAAEAIRTENPATANHANREKWARMVFTRGQEAAGQMLRYLLANFAASTVVQITGATDAALQTAVNAAVNLFADGT